MVKTNLAMLPPALDFMHDLLGDRRQQYRNAFWLTNRFEDHEWKCCFKDGNTKLIDFRIGLPDGIRLTDPRHAILLDTIKCFLCVQTHIDASRGMQIGVETAYNHLGTAIKLVDYLLLHMDDYKIHQNGFNSLTCSDLTAILLDIGSYRDTCEGIYRWSERLSQFLKTKIDSFDQTVLDDTLKAIPTLQNNNVPQSEWKVQLTSTELAKARAWLHLHDCYHVIKGNYAKVPNNAKLAALIYPNTLGGKHTNLPQYPELGFQSKSYTCHEYAAVSVTRRKDGGFLSEATFLSYCHSLKHLHLLSKIGLPVPTQALDAIVLKNMMEHLNLDQHGRFRTLPSHVVFSSLRKALEFAMTYGDELVDSYLAVLKAANANCKTLRQWHDLSVDIVPYLTPLIRSMGVKRWLLHTFEGKLTPPMDRATYYSRLRANEGLWELLRVLYGAVQIVVGTLMARRSSELRTLIATKCLDREGRHLIFFARKSGYCGRREKIARPIPSIASKLIRLIERLQTELIKIGQIDDYELLFSYPRHFGIGLVKVSSMLFNDSMDYFCDYIETPLSREGNRYYIRQHQLRRFFAMLFFWGSSFGGMDTLRWFLAHGDIEHLYHYITESISGEVLCGVQAHYVTERLKAYDQGVEQLADLLEHRFGTRKFDLLNTVELDSYIEDLIKDGQVTVEPEFFKDGDGKDYRILIKVKDKSGV